MKSILSQEEISAILKACGPTATSYAGKKERHIRPYDFARPDKLTKVTSRALSAIHQDYADHLSDTLTKLLETGVSVSLIDINQTTYLDYCQESVGSQLVYEVNMQGYNGPACAQFQFSLVTACVDAMTGGMGDDDFDGFRLTEIDKSIMRKIVESSLTSYRDVWKPHIKLTPSVLREEVDRPRMQFIRDAESVLSIVFEMRTGDISGLFSLCVPVCIFDKALESVCETYCDSVVRKNPKTCLSTLSDTINDMHVPCKAILGHTTLTMGDLMQLSIGDVLSLENKKDSEIEFWIADNMASAGTPGKTGETVALKITRPLARKRAQ